MIEAREPNSGPHRLGILALLWVTGVYLRLPILVAPPLAPLIGADLGLNQTQIGALTTVPVLMLSLGALPGSFAITRLGPTLAVALALLLLTLASIGRGLAPPVVVLFASTVLLGLAVAVMQTALPVLVVRWCPGFMALGSAVYMNGLLMGEFIGGGLTLPLVMPMLDGDWRGALAAWSLPALLVAAMVLLTGKLGRLSSRATPETRTSWKPPWREGRMWQLGIVLGAASAGFFGTNAYMGAVLAARGQEHRLPEALFWFNAMQVAGSLLMLVLARTLVGRRWPVMLMAAGVLIGLLGFALGGALVSMTAALLLGVCTCVQLILIVSLVPQMADERQAGPLAAGMFAIGYLLGFAVPLGGGVMADVSGDARAALLPMVLLAAIALAVAVTSRGFKLPCARHRQTVE